MSSLGTATGLPSCGFNKLFVDNIKYLASDCASNDNGKWIAIWSPSKSALNASQTRGWSLIALPSTNTGSNAWIPSLCSVGARFNITGWSFITSSNIPQTSGFNLSTILFAFLIFWAKPLPTNSFITKGLNNSTAISLGNPHWYIFSSGPTTITERPE